jgi:hypothetical protein
MAIAGPIVSIILGIGFALLAGIGYYGGWTPPVLMVLGYLASINLLVLAFNLIPAFLLDSGRVFRSILWAATGDLRRATLWTSRAGQAFAWLLIFWGVGQFFTGSWLGGIWTGLIGLFLNTAAQGSYQQVLIRQALQGEPVSRFMNSKPIVVPPSLDLLRWVEDFVYRYHHKAFPVVSDGHLEGCITTQALTGIPRAEWDQPTIGEVMTHDLQTITIPPDRPTPGPRRIAWSFCNWARVRRRTAARLASRIVGLSSTWRRSVSGTSWAPAFSASSSICRSSVKMRSARS